jgi:hypothetical protein
LFAPLLGSALRRLTPRMIDQLSQLDFLQRLRFEQTPGRVID